MSVLENHHARVLFQTLQHEEDNFLTTLSPAQAQDFRKGAIAAILATDMTKR